jgi:hypothetical protein
MEEKRPPSQEQEATVRLPVENVHFLREPGKTGEGPADGIGKTGAFDVTGVFPHRYRE